MGFLSGILGKFTKSGRNVKKKQRSLKRAQHRHQIASLQEELAFREKEDPREQAMLKQQSFARGIGKSTIADQDKERLDLIQRNRMAQLSRSLDLAKRGQSLNDAQNRFAKRTGWASTLDDFSQIGMTAFSAYSAGAGAGFWGGGGGGDVAGAAYSGQFGPQGLF